MSRDNNIRIVEATPVSHAPDHTRFDIPSWDTTYPITVYRMNPEQQKMLPLNQTQVMLLLARSLKQGKSPDLRENWNWQFVRLASQEEKDDYYRKNPVVKRAEVKMTGPAGMSPNEVYRHLSIQRQTALKMAVKQVHARTDEPTVEAILDVANRFADWIDEGIIHKASLDEVTEAEAGAVFHQPYPDGQDNGGQERSGEYGHDEDADIVMIPDDTETPVEFLPQKQEAEVQPQAAAASGETAAAQPEWQGDANETEWMQS